MKKIIIFSFFLLVFSSLSIFGQITNNNSNIEPSSEYVHGDILIKFKSIPDQRQAIEVERNQLISHYQSKVIKQWRIGTEHWKVDTLLPNYNLMQIIDSLNSNPFIEYAEPNYIIRADVIPNDPSFGDQWALNNTGQNGGTPDADIDAPEAWGITTGDTNIIVGVLDSGIDYTHPDLIDNIWTNWDEIPNNGIDDDNNGYIDDIHGWDFYNNDNDPMDDHGHGTHVAGTIGAVSDNGVGVTGVAWDVRMMALKFMGFDGSGPTSGAVSALEYANNMGVKITNNSWGACGYSQTLYDIIAAADTIGALFIAAAGNDATNNDNNPHYPANYDLDNIISVASTDRNDMLSTFSCYGINTVDIAAPGSEIYSTIPNNGYENKSGTSMAAPHISGSAVLIWNKFPGFTHEQVKSQILGSSDNINELVGKILTGSRLNLANAVIDTGFFVITTDEVLTMGAQYIDSTTYGMHIIIENELNESVIIDSLWINNTFMVSLDDFTFADTLYSIALQARESLIIYVKFHPTDTLRYEDFLKIYAHNSQKHLFTRIVGYGVNCGTIGCSNSGEWTVENSPYYINGNFGVRDGYSLKIHPGVEVLFTGYYDFQVHNSQLVAVGTITDSIIFRPLEIDIGWKGFSFSGGTLGLTDTLKYCSISYAFKKYASDEFGGGINAYNVNLVVENCEIFNNIGRHGGGIYFVKGIFTFRNLNIHHNQSIDLGGTGSGGGMCSTIQPSTKSTMDSIIFSNNHAEEIGGAFWLWQGEYYLSNIKILNNNCDGMYATAFTECDISIDNMLISGNDFSPNNSFTSIFSNSTSTIKNLTFANNGGALRFSGGQNTMKNSIVYNGSVPEISISDIDNINSSLNIFHSSLTDSIASFDIVDPMINMTDMTFGNPNFISTTDMHLTDSSFCIDKGDPSDDVSNEPFPNGYRINMGYYGGTGEAVLSSGLSVNFQPNPIEFGKISANKIYIDTLWIMNGGTVITVVDDIINNDTNHIILSYNLTNDTLFPSQVFPIQITFNPYLLAEGNYQSSIEIILADTESFHIPIISEVYTGTVIDSMNVYGIWCQANSPYKIINDIRIPAGKSLIIEPGVTVYFGGYFNFTIGQYSTLLGKGNIQDSIVFTPYLTDSWGGISFLNSGNDDTLDYFHLESARNLVDNGGGLLINNSSPVISNALIKMCKAYQGGAISINSSIVQLNNCLFKNNETSYSGAALFADSSTIYISSCDFINNNGTRISGGISLSYSSLFANRIYADGNHASYSGFLEAYSCDLINISNSIFTNNYVDDNPLIGDRALFRISADNFNLYNSSIINNNNRLISLTRNTKSYLNNCIIWGNSQPQILLDPYNLPYANVTMTIQNCDIENGQSSVDIGNSTLNWGTGNINILPEFIDSTYRLASNSPCIDMGINDSVFCSTDFDGNLRVWDGDGNGTATVDMGAYEYGAPLDCLLPTAYAGADTTICENDTLTLYGAASNQQSVLWSTSGDGTFDYDTSLILTYMPGNSDINNGAVDLKLFVFPLLPCANTIVDSMTLFIQSTQQITLTNGWNIISFNKIPEDNDMLLILNDLIASNSLVKLIDESGNFVQYTLETGWLNTIGNMDNTEGYYLKTNTDTQLELIGLPVNLPFEIPLINGWNMISFPLNTSQNAIEVIQNLIDAGNFVKAIDESGGFIQNIPGAGLMNTIGNFKSGEGYYIKVNTNTVLTMAGTPPAWQCGDVLNDSRDGQIYNTVQQGSQCWMAENLNIGTYIFGPGAQQNDNGIIEKFCYNEDLTNCDTYGGLYEWDEMMQYVTNEGVQGICPDGWHLPSDAEWIILTDFLGGESIAGLKMKSTTGWDNNGNGLNSSGFTGFPAGYYIPEWFYDIGIRANWWSSSEYSSSQVWDRGLYYISDEVSRNYKNKTYGFSVRCMRDQ